VALVESPLTITIAWFNPAAADNLKVRVCLSALTETLLEG